MFRKKCLKIQNRVRVLLPIGGREWNTGISGNCRPDIGDMNDLLGISSEDLESHHITNILGETSKVACPVLSVRGKSRFGGITKFTTSCKVDLVPKDKLEQVGDVLGLPCEDSKWDSSIDGTTTETIENVK